MSLESTRRQERGEVVSRRRGTAGGSDRNSVRTTLGGPVCLPSRRKTPRKSASLPTRQPLPRPTTDSRTPTGPMFLRHPSPELVSSSCDARHRRRPRDRLRCVRPIPGGAAGSRQGQAPAQGPAVRHSGRMATDRHPTHAQPYACACGCIGPWSTPDAPSTRHLRSVPCCVRCLASAEASCLAIIREGIARPRRKKVEGLSGTDVIFRNDAPRPWRLSLRDLQPV
jgi:hypothetical protein